MDFIVKLGETGLAFPYTNIISSEKVFFLQELIKRDTKIDPKDQVLFTKKGYKLHSDEVLATLEKENNFQATMTKFENSSKSYFTILLFDQKRMSSEGKPSKDQVSYFMESNEDLRNYLLDEKHVEREYSAAIQAEIDQNSAENIKKVNPTILAHEAKLFGHYFVLKKSFLQYVSRLKKIDRLLKEGESQLGSFDVLIKHASIVYNPCKAKKNDVTKKFITQSEKNSGILKRFEDSIDNLKKIELHDSLKTDKQKNLLDIYYDTEAMYKWKNSCVDFQSNCKAKIEKVSAIIKSLKKKIKDERDQALNSTHPAFQTVKSSAEGCSQETLLAAFTKVYIEYKAMREAIEAYIQNGNSANEDLLREEKWSKMVERDLDEDRKIFNEQIERAEKILDQLVKLKGGFEIQVGQCYRCIYRYASELNVLQNEKLKQLSDDIDKMDRDFNYLLNPSLLPAAYQASLIEVNRRRDFAASFDKSIKRIQTLLDSEVEQRKKFLSQYGRILPCQFIPQFKHMPPSISIKDPDADAGLPKIEGLIPKDAREEVDNSYAEELEKLNKELKLRIKKLEEENDTKSLKKRLDELMKEFESEKDKNKALKNKIGELEKDKLVHSFRRENSSNSSKDSEYDSMRSEFDNLAKIALNAASSFENQENVVPNLENKNSKEGMNIERLNQRVTVLNSLLQQTVKSSFDIFFKKLNEKQKKFDDTKTKFETLLSRSDEEINKEKSKLTLFYEEKLQDLNEKYSEAQKKLEEAKKYQKELLELRREFSEKEKAFEKTIEVSKQDIKAKQDLLKNKDEIIKSINSIKEGLENQLSVLKDKQEKELQKLKVEHHEVLNNVHTLNKQDLEKLKTRIKTLENDISNKNIELDKISHTHSLSEKDCKQKEDQIQKLNVQIETLNKKVSKLTDDVAAYKNKFDNMELTIQNKNADITILNKQLSTSNTEKNQLQDDLSKYKQFNNETNKRLQTLGENLRKLETEKTTARTEIEKLELELEKKKIENTNFKEQIEKITQERKQQLDELTKIAESQESEKGKISQFREEINEKNIQINSLKTKNDILSLDLENKIKENEILVDRTNKFRTEIEKLNEELEKSGENFSAEKEKVKALDNQLHDIKILNEQLQIESEIKMKYTADTEKNLRSAYEKISTLEEKTQNLERENESLKKDQDNMNKQNIEKISHQNEKSSELQFKIGLLEDEISKKNVEIDNLNTQIRRNNEDLDDLRERKSNLESSLRQKEEAILNLEKQASQTQLLFNDLQKQEDSYVQDVKVKDKEIQDLNDQNTKLSESLEKFRSELSDAQALLSKERESYENQLVQKKQDARSKIDYLKIEKGSKNLFIPYAPGIYVPFSLHQYTQKEIQNVLDGTSLEFDKTVYQTPEKSIKTSFFLDMDSLSQTYQEVLKNFSLLIVGTIKDIAPKLNKEIDPSKDSLMVKLENIEYMIGFEDEEMVMKNYV